MSKTISVKSRRVSSQCGNHWRVWAPNVETIDTFGLPKWKPLTHLGSTLAPWRWLFSYFSGKKRGNQDFSPKNKWMFRSQLQYIKSFWSLIGSLKALGRSKKVDRLFMCLSVVKAFLVACVDHWSCIMHVILNIGMNDIFMLLMHDV